MYTNLDVPGIVHVTTTGEMEAFAGNSEQFTSLAGVSFPTAAAAWKAFTVPWSW